jgi:pyridoxamine 5'-phosphate oxidase
MANAMVLSTAGKSGRPSSRVVLMKEFSENGFVFFSNYLSRKGKEIELNPSVALLFFWEELERQVRIEGKVRKISGEASSEYFSTRPRLSRVAATVSKQSTELKDRSELEEKFNTFDNEYKNKEIPRPVDWGGYIVNPDYFEFWQGRENRLHDRIIYTRVTDGWKIGRLSP